MIAVCWYKTKVSGAMGRMLTALECMSIFFDNNQCTAELEDSATPAQHTGSALFWVLFSHPDHMVGSSPQHLRVLCENFHLLAAAGQRHKTMSLTRSADSLIFKRMRS
jgi:hypothetical protein